MGPLKGLLFRLANFRPGLGGPKPENAAYDSDGLLPAGAKITRTPDGSVAGGAAGITFTELCESWRMPKWGVCVLEMDGDAAEFDEVDDAFDWWCTGKECIEDIDEDVDLRPRRLLLRR